ncbi:AlpA family transcriptional regulator [Arsenophonus sp. ENCA]|nr:AlpA family transcriptional regulator [Arsenophonus sp. ENCA]
MIKIMSKDELLLEPEIDRMIKEGECKWLTSIGPSTRHYMIKMGRFPKRYVYGPKTKLYRLSEVQASVKGTWKPE